MRSLTLMAACIALSSSVALADSNKESSNTNTNAATGTGTATASGVNTNGNTNVNTAGGGEGGSGFGFGVGIGKGGNADADASVKNSGNSLNVNDNDTNVSNRLKNEQGQEQSQSSKSKSNADADARSTSKLYYTNINPQAPVNTAVAPSASGDCRSMVGFGFQGDDAGVSFGIPVSSNWCRIQNQANWLLLNVGRQAAIKFMCNEVMAVEDTLGDICSLPVTLDTAMPKVTAAIAPSYQPMQPVE